ncbi:DUF551 domain-containing protein [Escherichia coli]|nr:DUF551 domain-containing protein [Escherichia coli]
MTTITKEFTKEQLIEQAKKNIEVLRGAVERVPGASDAAVIHLKLAEITLASLEADPVAYIFKHPAGKLFWALTDESNKEQSDVIPVYAAPPVPVVPAALPENDDEDGHDIDYLEPSEVYALGRTSGWNACRAAMLHSAEPASNHEELPLDYLQGQKDGLEWAAQLAEANHPQTGDWLYDDPLELAKAIRKGPDMPEFDGPTPVTPDGWISCSERMPEMGERQCYVLAADFKNNYPPSIPNTQVGVYGDWFNDGNPTWDDGDGEDLHLKEVTHWMPLPEPPQEMK